MITLTDNILAKYKTRRVFLSMLVAMPIAACHTNKNLAPPQDLAPPKNSHLEITAITSDIANPDSNGFTGALLVRFYQLTTPAPFMQASYFDLFENDQNILGQTMVGRVECILSPNQITAFSQIIPPHSLYMAVFAGYSDWQNSSWRIVQQLKNTAVNKTTILLSQSKLSATIK